MEKMIAAITTETLKTLSKVYNKTAEEIMKAATNGNAKVLVDIQKLVTATVKAVA